MTRPRFRRRPTVERSPRHAAQDICYARTDPSGQIRCAPCGMVYDRDDPDPPPCGRSTQTVESPSIAPQAHPAFASG